MIKCTMMLNNTQLYFLAFVSFILYLIITVRTNLNRMKLHVRFMSHKIDHYIACGKQLKQISNVKLTH